MSDYIPPLPDAVPFLFKGTAYSPPTPTEVTFIFGADDAVDDDGLRRMNYTILLTM